MHCTTTGYRSKKKMSEIVLMTSNELRSASQNLFDFSHPTETYVNNLPIEILLAIFSYLEGNPSDLIACSSVCKSWYSLTSSLISNEIRFVLDGIFESYFFRDSIFYKSIRNYKHWHIKDVEINTRNASFSDIWPIVCSHMESLHLTGVNITGGDLCQFLAPCTSLQILLFKETNASYILNRPFSNSSKSYEIINSLKHMKCFGLNLSQLANDAILHDAKEILPPLKSVVLSNNNISFSKAIYNRFYPRRIKFIPSENVFTFDHIISWIETMTDTLQNLDLSYTLFDTSAMKTLTSINNLKLKSLSLGYCYQINNRTLSVLCDEESSFRESLEDLNLTGCKGISSEGVYQLGMSLPHLKKFSVKECLNVSNEALRCVLENCSIEELNVSSNKSGNFCSLSKPFQRNKFSLKKISFSNIGMSSMDIVLIAAGSGGNITHLDFSGNGDHLKDSTMMMITTLLPRLQSLTLENCQLLTDLGLCGVLEDISKIKSNHDGELRLDETEAGLRIPKILYREATRDDHAEWANYYDYCALNFVKDAVDQSPHNVVERHHNFFQTRPTNITPPGIVSLKELKELNLSGVRNLTDFTLKSAFQFDGLVKLNLSVCPMIKDEGISVLVSNCPAIEELRISKCVELTDISVQMIVTHLGRLKLLDISYCAQLTTESLNSVSSCNSLRVLDISYCRNMSLHCFQNISLQMPRLIMTFNGTQYIEDASNTEFRAVTPPPAPVYKPGLVDKIRRRIYRIRHNLYD